MVVRANLPSLLEIVTGENAFMRLRASIRRRSDAEKYLQMILHLPTIDIEATKVDISDIVVGFYGIKNINFPASGLTADRTVDLSNLSWIQPTPQNIPNTNRYYVELSPDHVIAIKDIGISTSVRIRTEPSDTAEIIAQFYPPKDAYGLVVNRPGAKQDTYYVEWDGGADQVEVWEAPWAVPSSGTNATLEIQYLDANNNKLDSGAFDLQVVVTAVTGTPQITPDVDAIATILVLSHP